MKSTPIEAKFNKIFIEAFEKMNKVLFYIIFSGAYGLIKKKNTKRKNRPWL
jgi:hypothetical protein